MDAEEYYDSLDESSDYDSCKCPKAKKMSSANFKKQQEEDDDDNTDDSIPFYKGNLSMSRLDFTSSKCGGFLVGQNRKTSRPRLKMSIAPRPKPKKSYLEIFYNKNGANKYDMDGLDSSRPTCSSSSPKSFTTCDGDVVCDDVIDLYLKSESEISSEIKDVSPKRIPILDLHMDSGKGDYKFNSVLDKNNDNTSMSSRSHKNNISKKNSKVLRIPKNTTIEKFEIPTSKMESWKKRQQYGRKASQTNRIQMQEKRALQTLDKETKNLNKIST